MFARKHLLMIGSLAAAALCASPALAGGWSFGIGFSSGGRGHYAISGYGGYGSAGCFAPFTTYYEPNVFYYDAATPLICDPAPLLYRDYAPSITYGGCAPGIVAYSWPRSAYVYRGYRSNWPTRALTYSYRPAYRYGHHYVSPRYHAAPRYHYYRYYGGHQNFGGSFHYYRGGHGRSHGSLRWHR